jgi:hypothetical protein
VNGSFTGVNEPSAGKNELPAKGGAFGGASGGLKRKEQAMQQKSAPWMLGTRDGQLAMATNWVAYMTAARRTAWGVPTPPEGILLSLGE